MKDQRRKDLKGRVLHTGESQTQDGKYKGRYQFDYKDLTGKRRHVNSWRLTEADPLPKGCRPCKALRTLEAEIERDLYDGIITVNGNITLNEGLETYFAISKLKLSTLCNYKSMHHRYIKDGIGNLKITDISYSTIKAFYAQILYDKNLSFSTLNSINIVLNAVFNTAVKDHVIRTNPCMGVIQEMKKSVREDNKKAALTKDQQNQLLNYYQNNVNQHQYYNLIVFLLGTGCRIGEALGLVWDDIDFANGIIHIRRTFSELHFPGGTVRHMQTPKSKSSERDIPMFSEVKKVLLSQREMDLFIGKGESFEGLDDFVFRTKNGNIVYAAAVRYSLTCATDYLNKVELEAAEKQNRVAKKIPNISPHILRHTFCTRLCEVETNLKVIQSIMGHSNITITMNVYADCTSDFKQEELKRIDNIIKIC